MKRVFELVLTAVVAAIASVVPATSAHAGISCFDACTGPPGQGACGAAGLGCPPEGGQCIVCRDNNDCAPGGSCSAGVCSGLPCSPDAGGMPADGGEIDSGVANDSGMGPSDSEGGDTLLFDTGVVRPDTGVAPPGDGGARDAATSTRADAGGMQPGTGAGAGTSDRGGCSCNTAGRDTAALGLMLALVFVFLRRR